MGCASIDVYMHKATMWVETRKKSMLEGRRHPFHNAVAELPTSHRLSTEAPTLTVPVGEPLVTAAKSGSQHVNAERSR